MLARRLHRLTLIALLGCATAGRCAEPGAPLGYWPLDVTDAKAVQDVSSNGFHAEAARARWCPGLVGSALSFSGDHEFVRVPVPGQLSSFTLQAWARPADVPGNRASTYAIFGRAGFHNAIGYDTGKQFYHMLFTADRKPATVHSADTFEPGEWHLVTGVFDRKAGRTLLYVDASLQASAEVTGDLYPYAQTWYIGCGNPGSRTYPCWFKGEIDEVRLYDRALTGAEIAATWKSTQNGTPAVSPHHGSKLALGPQRLPPEIPPPVTDQLIERIRAQGSAEATLARRPEGSPVLLVNGREQPLVGGLQSNFELHHEPFRKAGIDIMIPFMNLGYRSAALGWTSYAQRYMKPFWVGAGRYDPSDIGKVLWRPLQSNPDAKLILWLSVDVYPGWPAEHADELMQNEKGDWLIANSHFLRFGRDPDPTKSERAVPSFWSSAFLADTTAMLRQFVRAVEATVPGNAVAGYMIMGGQDGQFYHWHMPNYVLARDPGMWADYSPAAIKAWRRWLEAKYGSVAALSAAWRATVTSFADAPVPKADELAGGAWLHDPRADRRAMDWKRFQTEGRFRIIEHFAKVVREASSRPVVLGCSGGDSGARRDLTTVAEFVRSPHLDFFLHQLTYAQRLPPSTGGINAWLGTYPLHGKMFVADWDFATWLQTPWRGGGIGAMSFRGGGAFHGRAENINMLKAMWRREAAQLWRVSGGAAYNPVAGEKHAYNDESIIAEMTFLRDATIEARAASPQQPLADVAFIYDEKAVDWCRAGLSRLHSTWTRLQHDEILASGVPCNVYYAEDLREGVMPAAKVYVFINQLEFDDAMLTALDRIKRDRALLVFLRYSGYAHILDGSRRAAEAMGIVVGRMEDGLPPSRPADRTHPLVRWRPEPAEEAALMPEQWTLFGPFAKEDPPPDLASIGTVPGSLRAGATSAEGVTLAARGGRLDLQAALGGHLEAGRWAVVFSEISSPRQQAVSFCAGADWWMDWWVNGKRVFDTLKAGNVRSPVTKSNHTFDVPLRAGRNLVAVRVISGSGGFVLCAGGPEDVGRFDPGTAGLRIDAHYNPVVAGPDAIVLANYAGRAVPAFGLRDHGDWRSMFIATPLLTRAMIQAIAGFAGAWRVTPAGTVAAVGDNFLMLHALETGTVPVTLKIPAVLTPWGQLSTGVEPALKHTVELPAGQTALYRLHCPVNE